MKPYDFWVFANNLVADGADITPASCRSAISRAYYAAYLSVVAFLEEMGVALIGDEKHKQAVILLGGSGDTLLDGAANALGDLRRHRFVADYQLQETDPEGLAFARLRVKDATDVLAELQRCRQDAQRWNSIRIALKTWEQRYRGLA
jgi:hypothetical protein